MKKRGKNVVAGALACVCLMAGIATFGCDKAPIVLPEYNTEHEMMIGAWLEPRNTKEDYEIAKEMGLTHLYMGGDYTGGRHTESYGKALETLDEVGLKAIIRSVNEANFNDARDYSQYPAVTGVLYWDEPFDKDFEKVDKLADYHMEKYGDKLDYLVNLCPNTVKPGWHPWSESATYDEYVDQYVDKIIDEKITKGRRIVSCDIYPLVEVGERKIILNNWLPALEKMAVSAKKVGGESHFFMQSCMFPSGNEMHPEMTEEDLRFQFATEMAFGVRGFTYFTYNTYSSTMLGIVSYKSGELVKSPMYDRAKKVNAELKAIQNVYLSFEWEGVMPLIGSKHAGDVVQAFAALKQPMESIPFVKSQTATQNTLFGVFKDGDGNDGLMVTNYTHPEHYLTDEVSIKFKDARKVVCYTMGTKKVYNLDKDVLNLTLEPGQGAFLIPVA